MSVTPSARSYQSVSLEYQHLRRWVFHDNSLGDTHLTDWVRNSWEGEFKTLNEDQNPQAIRMPINVGETGRSWPFTWELFYSYRIHLFVLIIVQMPLWDCKLPEVQRVSPHWCIAGFLSGTCACRCTYLRKCLLNWTEDMQRAKTHPWSNELEYLGTEPWNLQSMSTLMILLHSEQWETRFSSMPNSEA